MKFKSLPVLSLEDATVDFEQLSTLDILNLTAESVLQLLTPGTRRRFTSGITTLTWAAAATRSNVNTIAHGLGAIPIVAGATEIVPTAATFNAFALLAAVPDVTNVAIAGKSVDGAPGGGSTQQAFWWAIG